MMTPEAEEIVRQKAGNASWQAIADLLTTVGVVMTGKQLANWANYRGIKGSPHRPTPGVANPNLVGSKRHRSPVGTETRISGVWRVKVAQPDVWDRKSRVVWQQHHGKPIPSGYVIRHIDGDRDNFAIDNLICINGSISRRVGMHIGSVHGELLPVAVTLATLQAQIKEATV